MSLSFNIPTKVYIEDKDSLCLQLKDIKNKNILLILSESMENRLELGECIQTLTLSNKCKRIKIVNPNPTDLDLYNLIVSIEEEFDTVIAIGGGSAIDLGKGLIALKYLIGSNITLKDVTASITNKQYLNRSDNTLLIAIPTTAGTASELTSWGTVWKSDKTAKVSVDAPFLAPDKAYIIPEFTKHMSDRLTLSTGLDALTHAVESYWSKKSNPVTRELSKTSISLIINNLTKVLEEPYNVYYREKMCMASLFAGLAFANTRTTACHSISYPLTMKYNIEHGFACVLTLAEVMKKNSDNIIEINELLEAFGVKGIEEVDLTIKAMCKNIQELNLRSFGVDKTKIPEIVESSFALGRIDNNPVDLSKTDVEEILYKIY